MSNEKIEGFYYHYKHDPKKGVSDYAYEFLNLEHDTEINDEEKSLRLSYRPLYPAFVFKKGRRWDSRPFAMIFEFVDSVEHNYKGPRFTKITDEKVIAELEKIRDEMYTGRTIRL